MKNDGKDIIIEMPTINESFSTNLTDKITPMNICEMIQEAVYFENFNLSEQFSFQFKGTNNFLATRHCKIKQYADKEKNYSLIFRRGMESQTVMQGGKKLDQNDNSIQSNQQQLIQNQQKSTFDSKEVQSQQQFQQQQKQQSYQQTQGGIQIGGKIPDYGRQQTNNSNKNNFPQGSFPGDSQIEQSRVDQRVNQNAQFGGVSVFDTQTVNNITQPQQWNNQNPNRIQGEEKLINTQYMERVNQNPQQMERVNQNPQQMEREYQNPQNEPSVFQTQRMNTVSQPPQNNQNGIQQIGGEVTFSQHLKQFADPSASVVSSNYQGDLTNSQKMQFSQPTQTVISQNNNNNVRGFISQEVQPNNTKAQPFFAQAQAQKQKLNDSQKIQSEQFNQTQGQSQNSSIRHNQQQQQNQEWQMNKTNNIKIEEVEQQSKNTFQNQNKQYTTPFNKNYTIKLTCTEQQFQDLKKYIDKQNITFQFETI